MDKPKKQASYRIIRFPMADGTIRYVGNAWNFDHAVLIGTKDFPTYAEARDALDTVSEDHGVELRWFDGEYVREGDQIFPVR